MMQSESSYERPQSSKGKQVEQSSSRDQEYARLIALFEQQLRAIEIQKLVSDEQVRRLQERLSLVENQREDASPAPASAPEAARPQVVYQAKLPKMPEIEPFEGDSTDLPRFLADLKSRFVTHGALYPTDRAKCFCLLALMKTGTIAKDWATPILEDPQERQLTRPWPEFLELFKKRFHNPNLQDQLWREARELRQTTSVSTYIAKFELLHGYGRLATLEAQMGRMFYDGLLPQIKNLLMSVLRLDKSDYTQLKDYALEADERWTGFKADRTFNQAYTGTKDANKKPTSPPTAQITTTTTTTQSKGAPQTKATTDASSQQRIHTIPKKGEKISQEEKDRRRREGLCLYCGKTGHLAQTCLEKSNATRLAATATPEASSAVNSDQGNYSA